MVKKTDKTLTLRLDLYRCGNARAETLLTVALPEIGVKTTTRHTGDLEQFLLQAWKRYMTRNQTYET
jgi:hypothetical protein